MKNSHEICDNSEEKSQESLDSATLELFDHIVEILADEYVKAIKKGGKKDDESGRLRKIFQ